MGGCHHDLHDVITSITLIWATKGLAGRDRKTVKGWEGSGGVGLRDLSAKDHVKSKPMETLCGKCGVVRRVEDGVNTT